ncbi:nucleotidyltransferase domain-containing protein [Peribacillus frigoritolerans]|uniref:nucleotidyltransferase domain-containing protein n=1 Tax=Peribacillus frigoritolerans TaxID=450367 RepID=UPI00203F2302|nr:nucleotidyltransferase family protein [Peribacillus frigoritolerans]MCM3166356.1 nucleotidyltransferase family protein [Peribacillus frigoritolerans]
MGGIQNIDLSIMPKELKLLLQIINIENEKDTESINNKYFIDINWELFLELARHHRIYPLVYSKLNMIDGKLVPLYVIQTLYQEYKENTFQMLHLSGEMERVSKLFTENNIRLLFLKGPAIADAIYGNISLRTSKDLDILIPITDLKKAEDLLLNCGYEKEGNSNKSKKRNWWSHHVSYYHTNKKIEIEIHWRLYRPPANEPSFDELWKRKRISSLTSFPVYFFGKEDLFSYLVTHGANHGWFRLRWLADIDQIIRKRDITRVNNSIQNNHYRDILIGQALILTYQLFETPIHEDVLPFTKEKRSRKLAKLALFYIIEMGFIHTKQSLKDYNINSSFSKLSSLKKSYYAKFYQYSVKTNIQKFFFVMRVLNPNSADVKTLRLPKPLYFLYFPLRPLLILWRKTRNS